MLHLTEPWGTLLSYTAPNWATLYSLSCAAPYWAKEHPAEIHSTPYELAHHDWAMLHPTELRWRLLSFAEPDWATLCSRELLCSLLSYASPCELHYSLTELPSVLVPLCNFVKCRNAGLSGTGISVSQSGTGSVSQSGTGMLRYRTEMLDAGIPMSSYVYCTMYLLYKMGTRSLYIFSAHEQKGSTSCPCEFKFQWLDHWRGVPLTSACSTCQREKV